MCLCGGVLYHKIAKDFKIVTDLNNQPLSGSRIRKNEILGDALREF